MPESRHLVVILRSARVREDRANTFSTVLGDVKFGANGEWAQPRMLQIQFHGIKGNDVGQFRQMDTQTLLSPEAYKSGSVIYPYEKAK